MKPAKQSTCKVCKAKYTKTRPLQKVCGIECAKSLAKLKTFEDRKKAEAKTLKERKEAILTRSDWVKKAQVAFNAYIRARDAGKPCISCGRALSDEPNSKDSGHYRSVGSAPHMRFVESNAHAQCRVCNNYLGGNAVEYRKGLIARVGLDEVEMLERDQTLRKYTKEGLEEIAKHYKSETRRILKERNGI